MLALESGLAVDSAAGPEESSTESSVALEPSQAALQIRKQVSSQHRALAAR